jgi:predicted small lipoprotein YifL
MRVIYKMSAIVAASSISAATLLALGGCGQRGPLYLPNVPPMPQRPSDLQDTPPSSAAPAAPSSDSASKTGDVPDTSGEPLTLAPESTLKSVPDAPKAASSVN